MNMRVCVSVCVCVCVGGGGVLFQCISGQLIYKSFKNIH